MRLSLELSAAANVIRAYAEGLVTINDHHIRQSVIVTPERLITNWPPQQFDELASSHFQALVELNPEIVLLGTGKHQQFPSLRLTHPLLSRGVGLEIMDTGAACRTYNIIMAEGRRVAAALLMIQSERL